MVQDLPVVFAIDRAGFVGDDGKTHQGFIDTSYLRPLPNMVVCAPKDETELRDLLYTGVQHSGPFAVRYPRGSGTGAPTVPSPASARNSIENPVAGRARPNARPTLS